MCGSLARGVQSVFQPCCGGLESVRPECGDLESAVLLQPAVRTHTMVLGIACEFGGGGFRHVSRRLFL